MTTFESLLKPMSLKEFLGTYWDKAPLHIAAKSRDKLSEFPGLSEFPKLFSGKLTADSWNSEPYEGDIFATWGGSGGKGRSLYAPISQAAALFNTGASLCYGVVTDRHPALQSAVEDFMHNTGFKNGGMMTAYLTPPNSGGPMHFDSQHVFFFQVSGEKHWRVSKKPAIQWPPVNLGAKHLEDEDFKANLDNMGWKAQPASQSEFFDIVLKEGDVLYMPAGIWHEPKTLDSHSLHYTMGLTPFGPWNMISSYIRTLMLNNENWRRDLRFLPESSNSSIEAVVGDVLEELKTHINQLSAADLVGAFRQIENLPPEFAVLFDKG